LFDDELCDEEKPFDVHRREPPKIVDRVLRERFGEIDSGIVHQRVDRSELPFGSFDNSRGR